MKHQKTEFNWKLYEFSREELGLSTLNATHLGDHLSVRRGADGHFQSTTNPKVAEEIGAQ